MIWHGRTDGFALVELLVALALFSFVVLSAMGMLAMFGRASVANEVSQSQRAAFLHLFAVGEDIRQQADHRSIVNVQSDDLSVAFSEHDVAELRLQDRAEGPILSYRRGKQEFEIDLQSFDSAAFVYLTAGLTYGTWAVAQPPSNDQLAAVRIDLNADGRTLPVLLWSSSAGGSVGSGAL